MRPWVPPHFALDRVATGTCAGDRTLWAGMLATLPGKPATALKPPAGSSGLGAACGVAAVVGGAGGGLWWLWR